jgi:hypothetical protein
MASRLLHITGDGDNGGGGAPDPAAAFQRMLEKNNQDGVKLASTLFDENFRYRQTIREMKEQMPKDGAIVLTAEQAKKWEAYEALGQEPKDIKKSLDKIPDLEKTSKELGSMENLRELAEIGLDGSKLKVPVLKDLILNKFPDAVFRFVDEKDKDGNQVRNAYIKATADGQETSFKDFSDQNLTDYLPALKVTAEQQQPASLGGAPPDPKPTGGTADLYDGIRKSVEDSNKAKKSNTGLNPLARFGRADAANS